MLEIKNLNIFSNERTIINDINFKLKSGTITALVGKSGAGKSLCSLGIFNEFAPDLNGNVKLELDGKKLEKPSKFISLIMQNPRTAFSPLLNIKSHAKSILKSNSMLDDSFNTTLNKALQSVGLEEKVAQKYPFELSGGMLQRAMIALAIITKPKFLIADEPTTDLDAIIQTEILSLLSKIIKEQNMGLLLITHDFGVILNFADEILVLENGKIVENTSKLAIFTDPKSKSAKELLTAYKALS